MMKDDQKDNTKRNFKEQMAGFVVKYALLISLVLIIIAFSLATRSFLTVNNFLDILRSVSILSLIAFGVTFSVAVNGFDVSVAAIAGLAVMLSAGLMVFWQIPWYIAILICLSAGVLVGLLNAFLIVKIHIPDLLATLGTLYLISGLELLVSKGTTIYRGTYDPWHSGQIAPGMMSPAFLNIGQGYVLSFSNFRGVPIPVVILLVVAVLAFIFLEYTRYGRNMYAVGGNAEAARLSGINVKLYRTMAYVISGFLSAFGGLVLAARIGSGEVKAADPLLLDSVAATYFGFAFLGIGRPNILGTLLGAFFVGMVLNGLTMLNVAWYTQDVVKGILLIAALGLVYYAKRRA